MTTIRRAVGTLVGMITFASACREPNTAPAVARTPTFDLAGSAACPTPATVIVTTEAELQAAVAAAAPGQVIGVRGSITLSADVLITTPRITLTCASAGATLTAQATNADMVTVLADDVTVDHLTLDGSNASDAPYEATLAIKPVFTNNTVTCGANVCAFFAAATPRALVANNHFVSISNTSFGVHLQAGIDGSRVEGNTIETKVPIDIGLGGIRARDGRNVAIAHNVVLGPWRASIALADLGASVVEGNRLDGAELYGIRGRVGASLIGPISVTDNLFKANIVTNAGVAGVLMLDACRNTFVGNDLQGNAGNLGLIFAPTTGANTFVGNQTIVVNNGAFDCNGDGVNDPNLITGQGAVLNGATLGPIVSDAVVSSNRLR